MEERRTYRQGRFVYLLDDSDHTAWIAKGHIGRCKTYRVPSHVEIEGVQYLLNWNFRCCPKLNTITIDPLNEHLKVEDGLGKISCCIIMHRQSGLRMLRNKRVRSLSGPKGGAKLLLFVLTIGR